MNKERINAEVISVSPGKVRIQVDRLEDFRIAEEHLKVGSYLRISDNDNSILIAMIESFNIEASESQGEASRKHVLDAVPLGIIKNDQFKRGGDTITIPPKKVEPATKGDIKKIFESMVPESKKFCFGKLSSNIDVQTPVDGNKFFNKHIAVVGSTGAGKSHSVARIIHNAKDSKSSSFKELNNSHIIIFDIHSEYKSAFPNANFIGIDDLVLPYWLLNDEELEELFLESGDFNNYNQASVLRKVITQNKVYSNAEEDPDKIYYDSPLRFDIQQVLNCLVNLKNETKNAKAPNKYMIVDESGEYKAGESTKPEHGLLLEESERLNKYFDDIISFYPNKSQNVTGGDYGDKTLDKFISRFEAKINQKRLKFLFGEDAKDCTFENVLAKLFGYGSTSQSNITIFDVSGVPFEVLSVTVSLISRLIFEYGYIYKKSIETDEMDNPFLVVYEEAHKYAPQKELARYRSSKNSIERIAKEGRKYGVTLLLASQRPHEISETIFSQCNNFVVMRLTNPDDQNYVKRLLPDTMGKIINTLPTLETGEALLIGDAVTLPSVVKIDKLDDNMAPSSNDIPFLELWKEKWKDIDFEKLKKEWVK